VDELRIMRGLSYSIIQKMRVAKHAGLVRSINPPEHKYPDNSQAIINALMDEYKTIKQ
jgi:hypothetical protein